MIGSLDRVYQEIDQLKEMMISINIHLARVYDLLAAQATETERGEAILNMHEKGQLVSPPLFTGNEEDE